MAGALAALRTLHRGSWLAFDTETTGLGPYDVVLEIALVEPDGRPLVDTVVSPARPVTAKSRRIHGITDAQLARAPSWPNLWPELQRHLRNRPLVAWNAAFDLRLLRQTCVRYHLPLSIRRIVCLQHAFRELHPVTRPTLAAACLALGIGDRPTHRARVDADVARQVALKLMQDDTVHATS